MLHGRFLSRPKRISDIKKYGDSNEKKKSLGMKKSQDSFFFLAHFTFSSAEGQNTHKGLE